MCKKSYKTYKEILKQLETSIKFLHLISFYTGGILVNSNRKFLSSVLITRLVSISRSLLRILPDSFLYKNKFDEWDLASISSLIRNLIENYNIFYYISIEAITEEEEQLRLLIFELHYLSEKQKMISLMELNKKETVFDNELNRLKETIKKNINFKHLPNYIQKDILKGKRASYLTNKEISKKINLNLDHDEFNFVYKYTSNFLHTMPYSIYHITKDKGRGLKNNYELSIITMLIDISSKYITKAVSDFCDIFPEARAEKNKIFENAFGGNEEFQNRLEQLIKSSLNNLGH